MTNFCLVYWMHFYDLHSPKRFFAKFYPSSPCQDIFKASLNFPSTLSRHKRSLAKHFNMNRSNWKIIKQKCNMQKLMQQNINQLLQFISLFRKNSIILFKIESNYPSFDENIIKLVKWILKHNIKNAKLRPSIAIKLLYFSKKQQKNYNLSF